MTYPQQYPQNYPGQPSYNQPFLDNNMVSNNFPNQQYPPQYNQFTQYPQYPQQYSQPQLQPLPGQVTIQVQQQINNNPDNLPLKPTGSQPQGFYCTVCREPKVSSVHYKMGVGSWVWCLLCIPGISCAPCCMENFQEAIHECPTCRREVAKDPFCC